MRRYIRKYWLVILGLASFAVGFVLQAQTGTIDGSVLIPLPLIYLAFVLAKKEPLPTGIGKRRKQN